MRAVPVLGRALDNARRALDDVRRAVTDRAELQEGGERGVTRLTRDEALACGTPVVALREGAVPEVLRDGVTGIIVDKESDLVEAIHASAALSPAACRQDALDRFATSLMASAYEQVYRDLVG